MNPLPSTVVLASGVDSLYLAFRAPVRLGYVETLDVLKDLAQHGFPQSIELAGVPWVVEGHGAGKLHAFALSRPEAAVAVSRSRAQGLPHVLVQLRSEALWERGLEWCWHFAGALASALCAETPTVTVSRVDVCADLVGPDFASARVEDFVARASSKARHRLEHEETEEESRLRPDLVEPQEGPGATDSYAAQFTDGRSTSGFSFGRSAVLARIYDKTREIKRSGKSWLRGVWEHGARMANLEGPLPGTPGGPVVWRVEAQLRRDRLRDLEPVNDATGETWSIDTLEGLRKGLTSLFRYVTGDWLTWRRPSATNAQRTRWEIRAEWRALEGVRIEGQEACPTVRGLRQTTDFDRLLPGFAGYATALAALRGWTSPAIAWTELEDAVLRYLDTRNGEEWEDAVKRKRGLKPQPETESEGLARWLDATAPDLVLEGSV